MAKISPVDDRVRLYGAHVAATVEQRERRMDARFGQRGLTKRAHELGQLVMSVDDEATLSHQRLHRTTLAARGTSIAIVVAALIALGYGLRPAVLDGLDRTADYTACGH